MYPDYDTACNKKHSKHQPDNVAASLLHRNLPYVSVPANAAKTKQLGVIQGFQSIHNQDQNSKRAVSTAVFSYQLQGQLITGFITARPTICHNKTDHKITKLSINTLRGAINLHVIDHVLLLYSGGGTPPGGSTAWPYSSERPFVNVLVSLEREEPRTSELYRLLTC